MTNASSSSSSSASNSSSSSTSNCPSAQAHSHHNGIINSVTRHPPIPIVSLTNTFLDTFIKDLVKLCRSITKVCKLVEHSPAGECPCEEDLEALVAVLDHVFDVFEGLNAVLAQHLGLDMETSESAATREDLSPSSAEEEDDEDGEVSSDSIEDPPTLCRASQSK